MKSLFCERAYMCRFGNSDKEDYCGIPEKIDIWEDCKFFEYD